MGKLHTLRRAIEREPDKWFHHGYAKRAYHRAEGGWRPAVGIDSDGTYHRIFVRSVLRKLGRVVK